MILALLNLRLALTLKIFHVKKKALSLKRHISVKLWGSVKTLSRNYLSNTKLL